MTLEEVLKEVIDKWWMGRCPKCEAELDWGDYLDGDGNDLVDLLTRGIAFWNNK